MTSSTYLAMLFGTYIIAVSIPMIWNQKRLIGIMQGFIENPPLIFLTGILALFGGVSVIYFHNIWTPDWRSLITFFGWAAAIEGVLMLSFPASLLKLATSALKKPNLMLVLGFLYLGLGIFLVSRGFSVPHLTPFVSPIR